MKKAKDSAGDYRRRLDALKAEYDYMVSLWGEFDCDLLRIADVELSVQKIAGVRTPVLQDVKFEEKPLRPLLVARMVRRRNRYPQAHGAAGNRIRGV